MSWESVKLGDVATINPHRPVIKLANSDSVTFVPMESVDDMTGAIVTPQTRPLGEVRKGYTVFTENDVVFAKITPCMQNGKHAIARNLVNELGFGSTEFHVIRPGTRILSEWIHFFLRKQDILDAAVKTFTGAVGHQRVPDSFLQELPIPLPSLAHQGRIVSQLQALLAAVEQARQAAEAQLNDAHKLIPAILQLAFSEITAGGFVKLGDIASIQLGKMLSPRSKTGKQSFAYLRNTNVQWGRFDLRDLAVMDFSERERAKFELQAGDLIVCEGGEPGRCAVWNAKRSDCYYQKALHRIRPHKGTADSEFLSYWIRHQAFDGSFEDQNAKTTIAHLPLVRLEQLLIPNIPIQRQRRVAESLKCKLAAVDEVVRAAQAQLEEIRHLPSRLLAQAFAES